MHCAQHKHGGYLERWGGRVRCTPALCRVPKNVGCTDVVTRLGDGSIDHQQAQMDCVYQHVAVDYVSHLVRRRSKNVRTRVVRDHKFSSTSAREVKRPLRIKNSIYSHREPWKNTKHQQLWQLSFFSSVFSWVLWPQEVSTTNNHEILKQKI